MQSRKHECFCSLKKNGSVISVMVRRARSIDLLDVNWVTDSTAIFFCSDNKQFAIFIKLLACCTNSTLHTKWRYGGRWEVTQQTETAVQYVSLEEFSRYQCSRGFNSLSLLQPYDVCLSYSKSVVSDESRPQQVALSSARGVILNNNVHATFI